MRKSKYTESQIITILKEVENGMKVDDVCRQHGMSAATYYKWKSKYGGMDASELKRVKELEAENAKLKRMYANLAWGNGQIMRNSLTSGDATLQIMPELISSPGIVLC